jgi:hypothetical protein
VAKHEISVTILIQFYHPVNFSAQMIFVWYRRAFWAEFIGSGKEAASLGQACAEKINVHTQVVLTKGVNEANESEPRPL